MDNFPCAWLVTTAFKLIPLLGGWLSFLDIDNKIHLDFHSIKMEKSCILE
jgi:hypothetical protein